MICLIHGDLTDSKRSDTLFAISISLHNDASRICYDLTPYSCSLLYVIYMDYPDINTMYHPISCNTFPLKELTVNAMSCDIFTIIIYIAQKCTSGSYHCHLLCTESHTLWEWLQN